MTVGLLKYLRAQILMRLEYADVSEWSNNLNFWTIKLERFETKPFHFNVIFFRVSVTVSLLQFLATWRWSTLLIIRWMHLTFEMLNTKGCILWSDLKTINLGTVFGTECCWKNMIYFFIARKEGRKFQLLLLFHTQQGFYIWF